MSSLFLVCIFSHGSMNRRIWSFGLDSPSNSSWTSSTSCTSTDRLMDGVCISVGTKGWWPSLQTWEAKQVTAVITSENTAQFCGCRFGLKKQLYPRVSSREWLSDLAPKSEVILSLAHPFGAAVNMRFPSRQSLANLKIELSHQSSSWNQQKKGKTSKRKAASL